MLHVDEIITGEVQGHVDLTGQSSNTVGYKTIEALCLWGIVNMLGLCLQLFTHLSSKMDDYCYLWQQSKKHHIKLSVQRHDRVKEQQHQQHCSDVRTHTCLWALAPQWGTCHTQVRLEWCLYKRSVSSAYYIITVRRTATANTRRRPPKNRAKDLIPTLTKLYCEIINWTVITNWMDLTHFPYFLFCFCIK